MIKYGLMNLDSSRRFEGWYSEPPGKKILDPRASETFVYLGDAHGIDRALIQRLRGLAKTPPNHLILTGDLAGSDIDTQFKFHYYELVNFARPILEINPDISDESLIGYEVSNPPETLAERYKKLERFRLGLIGISQQEAEGRVGQLTGKDIAEGIRTVYNPPEITMYARWVASLSQGVRRAILDTVVPGILELSQPIEELIENGTKVHIVEGNWDPTNRGGFSEMAGEGVRLFDGLGHFSNKGAQVFRSVGAFETDTSVHVMWPIYPLMDGRVTEPEVVELIETVQQARERGKPVIHVAHIEPDWRTHFLNIPGATYPKPYTLSGENLRALLPLFGPSEIVYGHQHNPRRKEDGQKVDPNAKYLLSLKGGDAELVWDINAADKIGETALASFVPLRTLAFLNIPRGNQNRELAVHGGNRTPVYVKNQLSSD